MACFFSQHCDMPKRTALIDRQRRNREKRNVIEYRGIIYRVETHLFHEMSAARREKGLERLPVCSGTRAEGSRDW